MLTVRVELPKTYQWIYKEYQVEFYHNCCEICKLMAEDFSGKRGKCLNKLEKYYIQTHILV